MLAADKKEGKEKGKRKFPQSRILSTQQLVRQIIESNRNGERFCFILGSGASVESGIPTGNTLEMQWMDCIMGEKDDGDETPAMNVEDVRKSAKALYEEGLIGHPFEEIEAAWKAAKKGGKPLSSAYYFDIYKLRFYPNRRNGYRYLERIMETCEPSLGYHTLALLLTSDTRNNLVVSTNFDNLVEDALFLYTNKRPLVVSHESLAGYIESDIQRPIVAKVHRGLMYAPFNSPDTTNKLKEEWREALNYAFSTYTPIVIGYGGGDHSLMAFLEEENTAMRHGVYWCYLENADLPEKNICDFVENKDGYFVTIGGFDALMMEIGNSLYKDNITPTGTDAYLKDQYDERVRQYNKQWDKLNKNPELQEILQPIKEAEQVEEKKREESSQLTAWDHIRRGNRAYDEHNYEEAVNEYKLAIALDENNSVVYSNLAAAYNYLQQHEKAIEACMKAIELDEQDAVAYNNRGFAYLSVAQKTKEHEDYAKAIGDYDRAVELNPHNSTAYNNRGYAYDELGEYNLAIDDYVKAIAAEPEDATSYNNRAAVYNKLEQYDLAIDDCNKAIDLDSGCASAYNHRGVAYSKLQLHEKAIEDLTKAIQLDPKYKKAYLNRASVYRELEQTELAIQDEEVAAKL